MDPRQGSRRPTAAQNESSVSSITQGVSAVQIGDMAGRPSGEAKLLADARAAEGKVLTGKGETQTISYTAEKVIGSGSFGIVFQASVVGTGETVAIKKVLQDRRYKNRELQIMKTLNHQNVVMMKHSFYSNGEKPDEVYLNVVMEFVPETVYRVARHYSKSRQTVPIFFIKLYSYQMCRSLAYLHSRGICHRDIKPQNILLDPQSGVCKICDFGSAKMLVRGEPNVAYICSRYYRAPELVFGATDYTSSIDIWSVGCVIGELMTGSPLFPGENGTDQLVEIIKILGTPTREEIISMNPNYTDHKFPQVKAVPWTKVFRSKTAPEAIDLVSKMLVYTPEARLKPIDCMLHPFFDELRDPNTKMPNGKPLPPLFNFGPTELKGATPEQIRRLVPDHAISHLAMPLPQLINAVLSGGQGAGSSSSPSLV